MSRCQVKRIEADFTDRRSTESPGSTRSIKNQSCVSYKSSITFIVSCSLWKLRLFACIYISPIANVTSLAAEESSGGNTRPISDADALHLIRAAEGVSADALKRLTPLVLRFQFHFHQNFLLDKNSFADFHVQVWNLFSESLFLLRFICQV